MPVEKRAAATPLTRLLALACCLALPLGAHAAQVTGTFTVQINVTSSCSINSAPTLDFGSQAIFTSPITNTTVLQIQCTNGMPYTIGLDQGQGSGATVATRYMQNNGNAVSYSLYQDAAYSTVWGNTIGTDTVSYTGTGGNDSFTIWGKVFVQSTPYAGLYTDTITITVTY